MNLCVALAGNPNCGKTALFNALTGSHQKVGNWPGVTVQKKSGFLTVENQNIELVDLPGIYSLTVVGALSSLDEKIANDFLLSKKTQLIVNVIDASHLERNLYLTSQLLELGLPVIVALNMLDVAEEQGLLIDLKKISKTLGCPVFPIVANKKMGVADLKKALVQETKAAPAPRLPFAPSLQNAIQKLCAALRTTKTTWFAQQCLEGNLYTEKMLSPDERQMVLQLKKELYEELGEEPDILFADARYEWVRTQVEEVTKTSKTRRKTVTEFLDKIILNRFLGIPIFLAIMYCMFLFSINIGGAFQDFFDISSTTIFVDGLSHVLMQAHVPLWITALVASGVGKGINTTITFVPVIGAMFLFLSFLEDSGYMARAAFVMDRFMQALGLPGKAFVPMIVGFGCNVPAVMAARTLENPRDRILTIMMMPFMSCGARLAIFAVFASAFFKHGGEDIIFALYVIGIVVAVLTGFILRKTVLQGETTSMVMELPSYHLPQLSAIFRHTWYRLSGFLFRAGKVIVPICVLVGFLNAVTLDGKMVTPKNNTHSLLSSVGRAVTPVLAPMGIVQNNWPATVGLVTGILAKEVVIGTLNTLYTQVGNLNIATENDFHFWKQLQDAVASIPANLSQLSSAFSNPVAASEAPHDMDQAVLGMMYQQFGGAIAAFSYLLFVLLYFPCVSTMAVIRREINAGWAVFSVVWSFWLAYGLAVFCYQLFTFFAHPVQSFSWMIGIILSFAVWIYFLRRAASTGEPK